VRRPAYPTHPLNLFQRGILSPEMVESVNAFFEKREPDWPRD